MEEQIGHYRIVNELGRGAMGIVYLAHEDSLNRTVALKVLGPTLTESEEDFQRFHLEAKSLAQLNHRNIVQIYFVGEDAGRHYFAMEYVPTSLQHLLREEGRLESSRAAQLVLNAANGLAAAHERGIVHRDIKPANLLVAEDGTLKVADFGIARMAAAATRLTAADAILGTPRYISPEQCEGEGGDHRSDIYSLGVTFYEMLSGQAPFRSTSALALVREILQDTPPPIEEVLPEVDDRTRTIVGKMMAKNPEERYQSARELAADLQAHLLSRVMPDWDGRGSFPAVASAAVASPAAPGTAPVASLAAATTPMASPPTMTPAVPPVPVPGSEAVPVTRPTVEAVEESGTWEDGATAVTAVAAAPPRRSSSARWVVAALVFFLVAGVAAAAALWQVDPARQAVMSAVGAVGQLFGGQEAGEEPQQIASIPADAEAGEIATSLETAPGPEAEEWTPPPEGATMPVQSAAPAAGPEIQPAPASTVASLQTPPATGASTGSASSRHAGAPPPSGVAMAVWGDDPLIAGTLKEYLRARLGSEVELVEGPTLAEELVEGQPLPGEFLAAARDGGARHVVLATTTFLRERQLFYYGRQDTAYQSRVTLEIVDTVSQDRLSRWSGTVEYTAIQTEAKLDEVIADPTAELIEKLRRY